MKKLYSFIALLCVSLLFTGCSSDDDNSPEPSIIVPPSSVAFKKLQEDALNKITQKQIFKAENGLEFISKKGVELSIGPSNLFTVNGDPVKGDVELEFIEFYDRAAMLLANKPLMGKNNSGGFEPLLTGGQFYVAVNKQGEKLQTNYFYMEVPPANTGGLDDKMTMWEGKSNDLDNLEWFEFQPGQETGGVFPNAQINTYSVFLKDFGWSNIDRLANEAGEKTPIKVQVPDGYNNKNSAVYVAYKGQAGVLAFLDTYDVASKTFSEHYGWGPIGYELHLIFVSESNGKFVYAIQTVVLVKNKIFVVNKEDLKIATEEELTAAIMALP